MREGEIAVENDLESVPFAWDNRRMMQEIYELVPEQAKPRFRLRCSIARETRAQEKALRALQREYSLCPLQSGFSGQILELDYLLCKSRDTASRFREQ